MKRVAAGVGLVLALGFAAPSLASTRPTVKDTVKRGDTVVRLSLDIAASGTSHMWVRIRDPKHLYPYCTTVQFERKTSDGWRKVGTGSAYDRDCFRSAADAEDGSDTKAYWDNFAYPDGKLKEDFLAGDGVRVHGFTSHGGDVKFAFGSD